MTNLSTVLEKATRIEMRMAENGSKGQLTVWTHEEMRVVLDRIAQLEDSVASQVRARDQHSKLREMAERERDEALAKLRELERQNRHLIFQVEKFEKVVA